MAWFPPPDIYLALILEQIIHPFYPEYHLPKKIALRKILLEAVSKKEISSFFGVLGAALAAPSTPRLSGMSKRSNQFFHRAVWRGESRAKQPKAKRNEQEIIGYNKLTGK